MGIRKEIEIKLKIWFLQKELTQIENRIVYSRQEERIIKIDLLDYFISYFSKEYNFTNYIDFKNIYEIKFDEEISQIKGKSEYELTLVRPIEEDESYFIKVVLLEEREKSVKVKIPYFKFNDNDNINYWTTFLPKSVFEYVKVEGD